MAPETDAAQARSIRRAAAEVVMVEIWEEVLQTEGIDPEDDFFSCGGDSLLAIQVIGEAGKRGLAFNLIEMFKHPTIRGLCATLRDEDVPEAPDLDLLAPDDRAKVPLLAADALPASRLQLGIIYESLMSGGQAYVCTMTNDVRRPLDAAVLRRTVDLLTARHPMLRTRFDLSSFSEAVQIVERTVEIPLTTADYSDLAPEEVAGRTAEVIRELGSPFDPEHAPLLRLHAAALDPGSFRLTYGYHHVLLDGWSTASLIRELVLAYAAILEGDEPAFADPVPYAEFIRLERAAVGDERSRQHFARLVTDATAAVTVAGNDVETTEVQGFVPAADAERLTELAARWQLPPKSLLLAAYGATVAAIRTDPSPVLALLTHGRPEREGADLTLGLFINYLPVRLELGGRTWREAARISFEAERDLLEHRHFPHSEAVELAGKDAFATSFNYVNLRPSLRLVEAGLLGTAQFSDVAFDIPLGLDVAHTTDGLRVHVAFDVALHGAGLGPTVLAAFLDAVHRLVTEPDAGIAGIEAS